MKGDKPPELALAETIVSLCERFSVLPSALMAEDADLLRLLNLTDPDCGKAT